MAVIDNKDLQYMDSIESFLEKRLTNLIDIHMDDVQLSLQLNGISKLIVNVRVCTPTYLRKLLSFLIPICKTHCIRTICIRTSSKTIQNYCLNICHFQEDRFKKIKLDNEVFTDYILNINNIGILH